MTFQLSSSLPENCRTCGLYQNCHTWKVRSVGGITVTGRHPSPVDILFVGQNPGWEEDEQGEPFVGPTGQWLKTYTDALEGVSYAFTNAVKCARRENNKNVGVLKNHVDACRPFLLEDLVYWKPRVVVALGATALQALWPSGPSSVMKAKGTHKLADFWLCVAEHPANHIAGRSNLTPEYDKLFDMICRLLDNDAIQVASYDRTTCMTWEQVEAAVQHLSYQDVINFDFEVSINKDDHSRLTIWHPGCTVLTLAVCGADRKTFVFPMNHPESPFKACEWRNDGGAWILVGSNQVATSFENVLQRILRPRTFSGTPATGMVSLPQPKRKLLVGHNIKFDLNVLQIFFGIIGEDLCDIEDTFLKHFSLDQSQFGNNLGDLANRYLGIASWWDELWGFIDSVPDGKGSFADVPLSTLAPYNAMDVITTEGLRQASATWPTPEVYSKLLLRAIPVIRRMEWRGMPANHRVIEALDTVYTAKFGTSEAPDSLFQQVLESFPVVQQAARHWRDEWHKEVQRYLASGVSPEMLASLGKEPGINKIGPIGPKFISALAVLTGLETREVTKKTGAASYNAKAIEEFAQIDKSGKLLKDVDGKPLVPYDADWRIDLWRLIHAYRKGRNLLTTFIRPLQRYCIDGRIHTTFNLGKADKAPLDGASDVDGGIETGRVSTTDPNLLNAKKDPTLLMAYEAPAGYQMVKIDYSQDHLRRLADVYDIKSLKHAFDNNIDPYKAAAAAMWNIPLEEVDDSLRQKSKTNILAKIFLESTWSLAKRNRLDEAQVKDTEKRLNAAFPELEPAIQACFAQVDRGEMFISEFWGRRRSFQPDQKTAAWNNKMQSECGDICLLKTCEVDEAAHRHDGLGHGVLRGLEVVLFIYDAILFLVPEGPTMWEAIHEVRTIMLDARTIPLNITVPLAGSVEIGPSWARLAPIDTVEEVDSDAIKTLIYRQNLEPDKKKPPIWKVLHRDVDLPF